MNSVIIANRGVFESRIPWQSLLEDSWIVSILIRMGLMLDRASSIPGVRFVLIIASIISTFFVLAKVPCWLIDKLCCKKKGRCVIWLVPFFTTFVIYLTTFPIWFFPLVSASNHGYFDLEASFLLASLVFLPIVLIFQIIYAVLIVKSAIK